MNGAGAITEDDLIDFTPELRPRRWPSSNTAPGRYSRRLRWWIRRRAEPGGTIELYGSVGGADWTGAAFDPYTG